MSKLMSDDDDDDDGIVYRVRDHVTLSEFVI